MNLHLYTCITWWWRVYWWWRTVNLGLSIWPQKSVKWIIHLWIIKTILHMLMKTSFFSKSVWVQCGLSGGLPIPESDRSVGHACVGARTSLHSQCLEESRCVMLRWWRLGWLFQDLGFVEALPDVSSPENLSNFFSQSKLIWKYGQLKKKFNQWGEVSTFKTKQQKKPHIAVLSTVFFQWTCFPSFLPNPLPLSIITKLCAYDVISTGLLFTSWVRRLWYLWVGNQRWKTQESCVVQDYFQLCFLGLCLTPLFPLRNSFR